MILFLIFSILKHYLAAQESLNQKAVSYLDLINSTLKLI